MRYHAEEHFENLNCFKVGENLETLKKEDLVARLEKSFAVRASTIEYDRENN